MGFVESPWCNGGRELGWPAPEIRGANAAHSLGEWGSSSGGNHLWGVGPTPTVFLLDHFFFVYGCGEKNGAKGPRGSAPRVPPAHARAAFLINFFFVYGCGEEMGLRGPKLRTQGLSGACQGGLGECAYPPRAAKNRGDLMLRAHVSLRLGAGAWPPPPGS